MTRMLPALLVATALSGSLTAATPSQTPAQTKPPVPPVAAPLSPAAAIAARIPGVSPEQVNPAPVAGLYEVRLGAKIAYVSADGRYIIRGDIVDLTTEENVTEARRDGLRRAVLATVSEASMVVFAPAKFTDTITVFTDIDCGYCRKLHRQIADYNARGIRVRYMAFPREGPGSEAWLDAEKVWCSADRRAALTRAKLGEKIKAPACKGATVAQHYNIGRDFGLQGTPAIVLESGELIGGYLEPAELAKYLVEAKAAARTTG